MQPSVLMGVISRNVNYFIDFSSSFFQFNSYSEIKYNNINNNQLISTMSW